MIRTTLTVMCLTLMTSAGCSLGSQRASDMAPFFKAGILKPFDPSVEPFKGVDWLSGREPVLRQHRIPDAKVLEAFCVAYQVPMEGFGYYIRFETTEREVAQMLEKRSYGWTHIGSGPWKPGIVQYGLYPGPSGTSQQKEWTARLIEALSRRMQNVTETYSGPWGFYALHLEPPRNGRVVGHVLCGPHIWN